MKRPIHTYTLNPNAGTLDLSGIAGFDVRNLFAVIHLPSGTLIYAPTALQGYSALAAGVLTLKVPVSAMGAADPLLVLYDDGGRPAEDTSVQAVATAIAQILNVDIKLGGADLSPANRLPVEIDADNVTLKLPTGQQTSAQSVPVVLSSDGPFTTNFGTQADPVATSDAGAFSFIALTKRLLGKFPALGQAVAAASLPVVIASDQGAVPTTPTPANGTGGFTGVTVGTAQSVALAARVAPRRDLTLRNESASATIAVSFGGTPAINTAGSFTLGPGDSLTWSGNYVPLDAVNAIASAAGATLTIGSH